MPTTVVVSLEGIPAEQDVSFVSDEDDTIVLGTLAIMTLGPDPDYSADTDFYKLEVDREESRAKVTVKQLCHLYALGAQGVADVFQHRIANAASI